jgi:hypothetical protein
MRTVFRAAAALSLGSASAIAQGTQATPRVIDEGTFLLTQSGTPIGREAFRITRGSSPTGDVYRASAQITMGDRRTAPALTTDSNGAPTSYELTVRERADQVLHVQARTRPGRLSVLEQNPRGESVKEYVVPGHLVLLDDDIFHQYFFIALLSDTGVVSVILPQARSQGPARLTRVGAERLDLNGQAVPATHYSLSLGDGSRREFWLDAQHRVIRVEIPARGIVAQRDELPR